MSSCGQLKEISPYGIMAELKKFFTFLFNFITICNVMPCHFENLVRTEIKSDFYYFLLEKKNILLECSIALI